MITRTHKVGRCGAVIALSLASVFASSAVAMASPVAHASAKVNLEVQGTVTVLTPSSGTPTSVTIQPRKPSAPSENVLLGATTVYRQAGATVTVAALVIGVPVDIVLTGSPATAAIVRILTPAPIFVGGTVTALTPSSGTPTSVTIMPDKHHSLAVAILLGSSTVYRQAGAVVTVADLLVGSKVELTASGNPSTATLVRIAVPKPLHVEGMVTALNPSSGTPTSVTIQPNGFFKTPVTVALGAGTVYWQLKASTTVAALLVGSHVELTATGNPLTATVVHISAPLPDITIGSVTAVTSTTMTVQPLATSSLPVTFTLTNATSYFAGRQASTITEVNVGDIVRVAAASSAPSSSPLLPALSLSATDR